MRFFVAIALLALCIADPQKTRNNVEDVRMSQVTSMLHESSPLRLSLSTNKLNTSGWVTVSWENVLEPTEEDWIGVFNHPLELSYTPSKYRKCSTSGTHMNEGKGSMQLYMLNMRHDNVFVYFTNGTDYPIAIAASDVLTFSNPNEPLQGHLLLGAKSSEMRVMWTTRDLLPSSYVLWGTDSDNLDHKASATQSTYTRNEMCGGAANGTGWMDPGVFQSALMTDLKPHTRYFYKYGSEEYGFASSSFLSPPLVGKEAAFQFLAFGDMGQAEIDGSEEQSYMTASLNTTRLMANDVDSGAELLLHIGDISYARGYVSQWDVFFSQISSTVSQRLPYMTGIGNHERGASIAKETLLKLREKKKQDWPNSGSLYDGDDSGGECGVAYERRFPMPTAAQDEPWYSFEYGSVHFVMISTEHDFGKGSKQYKFIESDLESVNRTRTPWLIVTGHRPMYIDSLNNDKGGGDLPVARDLRRTYEDMFFKHKVDVFLGGHHHSYQRSCSLYKNVCFPKRRDGSNRAPIYYVIGMAGAGSCTNVHRPLFRPWYIEKVDVVNHGYTRVNVNETHLNIEFVTDVTGEVLDSHTIVQPMNTEEI